MKKLAVFFVLVLVIFSGCTTLRQDGSAKLTISNQTYNISEAEWNGVRFGPINGGQSVIKEVISGNESLYLQFSLVTDQIFEIPLVDIKRGENKIFIVTGETKGIWINGQLD